MNITAAISLGIGLTASVVGVFCFGWLNILKETNSLLKSQVEELKKANIDLSTKHIENTKQLSSMQGQLDIIKSIPLVNIDTTLQEIAKFNKSLAETNLRILNRLDSDANILATGSKERASRVEDVRTDLKNHKDQ